MPRAAPILVAIALAACQGPDAWSPEADHRRDEARRARALAAQLEAIPGVTRASVVLDEPYADPLTPAPSRPARAAIVLTLARGVDADAVGEDARRTAALLTDAEVTIVAAPALAPATAGANALKVPLAIALMTIVAMSAWIVATTLRGRRGVSQSKKQATGNRQ